MGPTADFFHIKLPDMDLFLGFSFSSCTSRYFFSSRDQGRSLDENFRSWSVRASTSRRMKGDAGGNIRRRCWVTSPRTERRGGMEGTCIECRGKQRGVPSAVRERGNRRIGSSHGRGIFSSGQGCFWASVKIRQWIGYLKSVIGSNFWALLEML